MLDMAYMGSWQHGVWSIRIERYNQVLTLKAPWNLSGHTIFSERYGYYKVRIPFGFGWRIIIR
jgi:hypothetical protein